MLLAPAQASAQVLYRGQQSTIISGNIEPMGIGIDGTNMLYVADGNANSSHQNSIVFYQPNGAPQTTTSYSSRSGVAISCPCNQIAVAANGTYFEPETEESLVFVQLPNTDLVSAEADGVFSAMALDPSGSNLFLLSNWSNFIGETSAPFGYQRGDSGVPSMSTVMTFSGLNPPTALAVDASDNLYVGAGYDIVSATQSSGYNSVTIYSGLGNLGAGGLAVDASGTVYGTDSSAGTLFQLTPTASGYVKSVIAGGLSWPEGVILDQYGNIYVSDTYNDRVLKFQRSVVNFGTVEAHPVSSTIGMPFSVLAGTSIGNISLLTNGAPNLDYTVGSGTTCTVKTYSSTANCVINVTFSPTAPGPRLGELILSDPSGKTLFSQVLQGQGNQTVAVFNNPNLKLLTPASDSDTINFGASVVDGSGNVYVTAPASNEIMEIPPGGAASVLSLSSPVSDPNQPALASATLNNPTSLTIDGWGNLYIADTGNNRILVRQPVPGSTTGQYYLYKLNTDAINLVAPTELTVDGAGNLYFVANGNNAENLFQLIVELTPQGVPSLLYGTSGNLDPITAIVADGAGDVYAASDLGLIFIPAGNLEGEFTGHTISTGNVALSDPEGLALDSAGDLYIADAGNLNEIVEVTPQGSTNVIPTDHSGYTAPTAISIDSAGNLYPAFYNGLFQVPRASASLGFAETIVGQTSVDSPQTVQVDNVGNQNINIQNLTYPADFPANSAGTNLCATGMTLSPGALCNLSANFHPTSANALSESIYLYDTTQAWKQGVSVSGTGSAGGESQTITSQLSSGTFTKTPSYPYAAAGSLVYIQASSGLPVTLTVLSGPGNFSGAPSETGGNNILDFSAAGTIVVEATQPGNATYAPATPVEFSVTVTPVTITLNSHYSSFIQVYGGAPVLSPVFTGLIHSTDQLGLVVASGVTSASPVGSYPVSFTLVGPMASSYLLSSATGTLTVTPAPATVTANDSYQLIGATPGPFTYTLTGLVNGDQPGVFTGTPILSTTATASSPAGNYPIDVSPGTLASANYTVTTANGVLDVFAPINMRSVAAGSVSPATFFSVGEGPASSFASVEGSTNAVGESVFHANPFPCSAGACIGTITFAPPLPGIWTGSYKLLDSSSPPNVLLSIPATGIGTGPQIAFSPAATSMIAGSWSNPSAVALDEAGDLYVADSGNNQIVKVPISGGVFGTPVPLVTGLSGPGGVAVDGAGNVYYTDGGNNAVAELPWNGTGYGSPVNIPSGLSPGWSSPGSVAVDGQQNLFVIDGGNKQVIELPWTGAGYGTAIVLPSDSWSLLTGVAVDGNENVYVADTNNNEVYQIPFSTSGYGTPKPIFTGIEDAESVGVDAVGNVYVTDESGIVTRLLAQTGGGFGAPTTVASGLHGPAGLGAAANGNIFVAALPSSQVVEVDLADPPPLYTFPTATAPGSLDTADGAYSVTVTNTGNANLVFSALTYPADFPEAPGVSTDCTSSTTLAEGTACTLTIDFSPVTAGGAGTIPLNESVTVTTNALYATAAQQTISVSGTEVIPAAPLVSLSATSVAFGNQSAGTESAAQVVTLTNTGQAPLTISSIALTEANTSQFIYGTTTSCTTVAINGTCTFRVRFNPTVAGAASAAITITDNAAGSPHAIALSGTGVQVPVVSLSASTVAFGNQTVGTQSAAQVVTLTNTGQSALSISSIALTGANTSQFVYGTTT
ncbi:MAG TPA: choice-of-anchor D domain-containing protein, partial [Bryobacteraceae bacterium]